MLKLVGASALKITVFFSMAFFARILRRLARLPVVITTTTTTTARLCSATLCRLGFVFSLSSDIGRERRLTIQLIILAEVKTEVLPRAFFIPRICSGSNRASSFMFLVLDSTINIAHLHQSALLPPM